VNTDGHPGCNTKLVTTKNPIGIYGGSFQFLGSLSESTVFLGENNFVMSADGSETYWGPTATASLPVAGGVGDIQAISQSNLMNPTPQNIIFSNAQCEAADGGDSAVFNSIAAGINELRFFDTLPFNLGSFRLQSRTNNQIVGIDSSPPSILISLKTANLTLQQTISNICPKLESLKIEGCYLCPGGAMWTIKARSDCLNGACLLSMTGDGVLTTSSIYIGKEVGVQYVNFTAPIKVGSVTLKCESGINEDTIHSGFSLDEPHTVIDPNGTHTNFTPGVPTDGGTSDWDLNIRIGIAIGSTFGILILICSITILIVMCKPKVKGYKSVYEASEDMREKPKKTYVDDLTEGEELNNLKEEEEFVY
jgi:hypothetical protein